MRRRINLVLALSMAMSAAGSAILEASDSFFQHMSPFPFMRNDGGKQPAATHEQLQPASQGLNRRGIHARVDPQLQHRQWRRADGVPLTDQLVPRHEPTPEQMRAYLAARGIDPQRLDPRFARVNQDSQPLTTNAQVARSALNGGGLARPTAGAHQVRQLVPPQLLNVRLGKASGVAGATHTVGDRSVGAGVGRVRSRR